MGEKSNPSFTHKIQKFYHESGYIRLLMMIQVQIMVDDLHKGHLGSGDVIRGQKHILASNSRLKRATDMGVV